jgi:hypothetical protein
MNSSPPTRKSGGTNLTEFVLRLISAGHLTEKLVFISSIGFFCFVLGYAVAHQVSQTELRDALNKVANQQPICTPA